MAEAKHRPSDVRVGRLTKPHGLKGALKLELYTDDPERRFVPGAVFSLQVPKDSPWFGRRLTLTTLRWYNGSPVAFFDGIDDRTAAESVVRAILWVDGVVGQPEENAWYDQQLVGLTVRHSGHDIGAVKRVDHLPAQDLLVVATEAGETMIPFVSAIVPDVDLDAGTITITPPRGLLDQTEAD